MLKINLLKELEKKKIKYNQLIFKYGKKQFNIGINNGYFTYKKTLTDVIEQKSISGMATYIVQKILKKPKTRVNGNRNFYVKINNDLLKVRDYLGFKNKSIHFIIDKGQSNKINEINDLKNKISELEEEIVQLKSTNKIYEEVVETVCENENDNDKNGFNNPKTPKNINVDFFLNL